jgi:hypothetical protein
MPPREYELELYDTAAKKLTASRTCKVVGE